MNIGAKLWSWFMLVVGVFAFVGGMSGDEFDLAALIGGTFYVVTALVALTYIWRDDAVQKQKQKDDEERRIAAIVDSRLRK